MNRPLLFDVQVTKRVKYLLVILLVVFTTPVLGQNKSGVFICSQEPLIDVLNPPYGTYFYFQKTSDRKYPGVNSSLQVVKKNQQREIYDTTFKQNRLWVFVTVVDDVNPDTGRVKSGIGRDVPRQFIVSKFTRNVTFPGWFDISPCGKWSCDKPVLCHGQKPDLNLGVR